ncbi:MBL fold metallo-hydrolase [Candidatus Woesearchaeota archaeon]|nr:MBL fold metallo-hydrolase [Candidatus Woesearchaeota archaeon]
MKKTVVLVVVFALLASVLLFGCKTEDDELGDIIKVVPAENSSQNITQPVINETPEVVNNSSDEINDSVELNETDDTNETEDDAPVVITHPPALRNLTIEYLNQMEGNVILVLTPKNKRIVIDGGTNKDGLYVVKYLLSKGIYKVDYVFASNAADDNVGGLDSVILNYNETVPFAPALQYANANAFRNYVNYANFIAHTITFINKSDEIDVDENLKFEVFVPYENESLGSPEDDTLVFRLEYGDASFLFLGDCTETCLENLGDADLDVDVVKTNSILSNETLERISPKVIVFKKIPENFTSEAKLYDSADGALKIVSDGSKYYISTVQQ